MVALYTGNGSGTKLYQGFLDGHPQIYMIPGYPLMYLYPHWEQWQVDLKDNWTWPAIIDAFCTKHASVLDSRCIPGNDGLSRLGKNQDEYLSIDEELFRTFLTHLLDGQPVSVRTFLLAVHYAYAFCQHEDLCQKKVLVYHSHVPDYVPQYLFPDFPHLLILAMVRDSRSNFRGRYFHSGFAVDGQKLNRSDAIIFRRRTYLYVLRELLEGLNVLEGLDLGRVRVIRHEDLYYKPKEVMKATSQFIDIDDHPCFSSLTFGGHLWWSADVYGMKPMNKANPSVVSLDWKKHMGGLDWYAFEGLFFRYFKKYGYKASKYRADNFFSRLILFFVVLLPSQTERSVFWNYVGWSGHRKFLGASIEEATGVVELKDYSFNAFYRHKWCHRDLNLWKTRWYVRFLVHSRRRALEDPSSLTGRFLKYLSSVTYVCFNLCRYWWSMAIYPAMIIKRWRLSLRAIRRLVQNTGVLPDTLP